MKKILLSIITPLVIIAEPSVYSDSDFVDTDMIAKKNSRNIFLLKQKIANLNEKIEGLKTLLNSQSREIAKMKQKINNNNYEKIINQLASKIALLENNLNNRNNRSSSINIPKQKEEKKSINIKEEEKKDKINNSKNLKLSTKDLYKKAVLDFNDKKYISAKRAFNKLLLKGYKTAEANFYLGEIAFNSKQYKKAIDFYQNSVTLNEDAIYMDKLLLHTAIALKKLGKFEEAKNFFKAIITTYPNSASAKEAKKYLK